MMESLDPNIDCYCPQVGGYPAPFIVVGTCISILTLILIYILPNAGKHEPNVGKHEPNAGDTRSYKLYCLYLFTHGLYFDVITIL